MLAYAFSVGEQDLFCDLVETYHIFNYRELPATQLAALVFGLRDNSRIKMKIAGARIDMNTMLLAGIYDSLAFIAWSKTENAQKNINRPKSMLSALTESNSTESDLESFTNGDDFRAAYQRIVGGE